MGRNMFSRPCSTSWKPEHTGPSSCGHPRDRTIKWTAQDYCIQHSLGQGNNGMRYGGFWSQTADRRIKIKHYQKLVLKINPQAQCWVSSLQRRAGQNIFSFSKELISSHRSLIEGPQGLEDYQPEKIKAPGCGSWAHSPHSCTWGCWLTPQHLLIPPSCLVTLAIPKETRNSASWVVPVNHHGVLQRKG